MTPWTADLIAQRAYEFGLLDDRQLQLLWSEPGARDLTPDAFKQLLLRRDFLSNYQVDRLLRGEKGGFFFGDYKVVYQIGAGTFARVFRAVHRENGRVAAVKVLRSRFSQDVSQRDQFLREAEFVRPLKHPNIVQIHEVASKGLQHYMVMEFVEGRTLREFLRTAPKFDPVDAVKLMTDMAAGLDFAFQKGITHRDLKPSNVLVSSQRQAKLADFGLAAADASVADEGLLDFANPRTVDYAGLERTTGVRKNDPRSDIYFLGCMYYHMLSGVAPLPDLKDKTQRMGKERFTDVKPLLEVAPAIPRNLAAVVTRAMDLNASLRYQRPAEMYSELMLISKHLGGKHDSALDSEGPTLLMVESNERLQTIFREKLRENGYRLLLTSDVDRPANMVRSNSSQTIDCVVFSTGDLKEP
ncbi:MAG TPA: serine/threonine-protein kinase, partial [Pirellulales bacterium]|nr:serine/threonine-protein kinase [Pirellulales bacterium]